MKMSKNYALNQKCSQKSELENFNPDWNPILVRIAILKSKLTALVLTPFFKPGFKINPFSKKVTLEFFLIFSEKIFFFKLALESGDVYLDSDDVSVLFV